MTEAVMIATIEDNTKDCIHPIIKAWDNYPVRLRSEKYLCELKVRLIKCFEDLTSDDIKYITDFNIHEEYVYLLRHPFNKSLYKIGFTSRFQKRLSGLASTIGAMPYQVLVLKLDELIDPPASEIESFLHEWFKARFFAGEWYLLTDDMIAAIYELFYYIEGTAIYGADEPEGPHPNTQRFFTGPMYDLATK